ncbi:hypothetical protein ACFQY7_21570 [Actinomadura luteofluorescens]|uniref:hypothetical protein n=1 Tax=Actinomadura luteofluorescens TaxID=46163 RepID=UPI00362E4583
MDQVVVAAGLVVRAVLAGAVRLVLGEHAEAFGDVPARGRLVGERDARPMPLARGARRGQAHQVPDEPGQLGRRRLPHALPERRRPRVVNGEHPLGQVRHVHARQQSPQTAVDPLPVPDRDVGPREAAFEALQQRRELAQGTGVEALGGGQGLFEEQGEPVALLAGLADTRQQRLDRTGIVVGHAGMLAEPTDKTRRDDTFSVTSWSPTLGRYRHRTRFGTAMTHSVVIIGSGFGGIGMAIRLRRAASATW